MKGVRNFAVTTRPSKLTKGRSKDLQSIGQLVRGVGQLIRGVGPGPLCLCSITKTLSLGVGG